MKHATIYPDWVLVYKKPGTRLRCVRSNYYLYEWTTYYDEDSDCVRSKTTYLGKITKDEGLVAPKHPRSEKDGEKVKRSGVYEYGLSKFITESCTQLVADLKAIFPKRWRRILLMAYCRVRNQASLVDMAENLYGSYLLRSLELSGDFSESSLKTTLWSLGRSHKKIESFREKHISPEVNQLFKALETLDKKGVKNNIPIEKQDMLVANSVVVHELLIEIVQSEFYPLITSYPKKELKEGWKFINTIALQIYYLMRCRLLEEGLFPERSVPEVVKVMTRHLAVSFRHLWVTTKPKEEDLGLYTALNIPIEFVE